MRIILGLGNPGEKYKKTFHNLGFLAVEDIAIALGVKFKKRECNALTAQAFINGEKIVLAKPQTFMNLSGESLKELMSKYKVTAQDVLVIYDDYDLPKGSIRLRESGGSGTHNGIRNIVAQLKSIDFKRLRIGIKNGGDIIPIESYVLSEIPKTDLEIILDALKRSSAAAIDFASGAPFDSLMQKYNTNSAT